MKIALLQCHSSADMAGNIAAIEKMVAQAAMQKAELIATPENVFLMAEPGAQHAPFTQDTHPGIAAAREWAKAHGTWILLGGVAVLPDNATDHKTHNRSLLLGPDGMIRAHYDKIHLFDVEVGDGQSYRESARFLAGGSLATAAVNAATLGLSICYDVRFPQLYRALAKQGAHVLTVPAAFTQVTGEAHWHVLLRARAIENGCFVIAPAQTGMHAGGRKTYGHSLVVDPWGKILHDGGTEVGVVMADIDLGEVAKIRARIPSLEHDRPFAFS